MHASSSAIVFSSSRGGELSYEPESLQNGVLTHELIAALSTGDADNDGWVTIAELRDEVARDVAARTGGLQNPTIDRDNLSLRLRLPRIPAIVPAASGSATDTATDSTSAAASSQPTSVQRSLAGAPDWVVRGCRAAVPAGGDDGAFAPCAVGVGVGGPAQAWLQAYTDALAHMSRSFEVRVSATEGEGGSSTEQISSVVIPAPTLIQNWQRLGQGAGTQTDNDWISILARGGNG